MKDVQTLTEAASLLAMWQTHLGASRDQCDEQGKKTWDRIATTIAGIEDIFARGALVDVQPAGWVRFGPRKQARPEVEWADDVTVRRDQPLFLDPKWRSQGKA